MKRLLNPNERFYSSRVYMLRSQKSKSPLNLSWETFVGMWVVVLVLCLWRPCQGDLSESVHNKFYIYIYIYIYIITIVCVFFLGTVLRFKSYGDHSDAELLRTYGFVTWRGSPLCDQLEASLLFDVKRLKLLCWQQNSAHEK